jgi:hypothetical protein
MSYITCVDRYVKSTSVKSKQKIRIHAVMYSEHMGMSSFINMFLQKEKITY